MSLMLGIESSCDETAASLVENGRIVRSNVIASQNDLHERYGGVVPEIASRAHVQRILPVIDQALTQAGATLKQVDAIAVGNRPGLIGSLLVGVSAAKSLAWSLSKPLIGIDHVQAHLYAAMLSPADQSDASPLNGLQPGDIFPALGLVVSGGHTSLYRMDSPLQMTLLGRTIDDAVGEAYDKAAAILKIGFPGGPKLDKMAQSHANQTTASMTCKRPEPKLRMTLLEKESLDFSYSGLKTALLYQVRGFPQGRGAASHFTRSADDLTEAQKAEWAHEFQQAAIGTVRVKIQRAVDHLRSQGINVKSLLVGGGVSANSLLRQEAQTLGQANGLHVGIPRMAYCLDNAAMIAGLADVHFRLGRVDDLYLPAIATTSLVP